MSKTYECCDAVRYLGTTFGAFLDAVKASRIAGKLSRGSRTWTESQLEAIREYLS